MNFQFCNCHQIFVCALANVLPNQNQWLMYYSLAFSEKSLQNWQRNIHSFSARTRRAIIIARICHLVAFVWCPLQAPFPYSWTAIMVRRLTLAAVEERGLFIFSCFNFLKLNCLVFSWQMWDRCFEERDAFLVHCASKVSSSIVKPCICLIDITYCSIKKKKENR